MNLNAGALYDSSVFDSRFGTDIWSNVHPMTVLIMEKSSNWWGKFLSYVGSNDGMLTIGVLTSCVSFLGLIALLTHKGTGAQMNKKRQQQLQVLVSDSITDAIDDLLLANKITKAERRHLFKLLGTSMKLPDLLPAHSQNGRTKKEIRHRLGNGVYQDKPEIPGDKPLPWETIEAAKATPVRKRLSLQPRGMRPQSA